MPLLPSAVVCDSAGDLFIADANRNQVLESTAAGALVVVAGTGMQGFGGDGGPATSALLNAPQGLALRADGTIYVADTGNQRVRAIAPAGSISTVAGTGAAGFSGEGGLATAAALNRPLGLAVDGSGALLIVDSGNQRVRRVSAGLIRTLAGTGVQGFAGDGGQAVAAALDGPSGLAVMGDGTVVLADTHNQRLRAVAPDGTIRTLAGTGAKGFAGDGGPAVAAKLSLPRGVAVLPDGTVVFADSDNQRLRALSSAGVISTIVGSGVQGAAPDGTLPLASALNAPRAVAGSFAQPVFADSGNRLVRALLGSGVYSAAGMAAPRTSVVSLQMPATAVYGTLTASAAVQGSVGSPQGSVLFREGATALASVALSGARAGAPPAMLGAGSHVVSAYYAGDGFNPAAVSATASVTVSPAAVVATADQATMPYGAPVPGLTGTLSGIVPQDSGKVQGQFSTTATSQSGVGTYPIAAALSGPAAGNYTVLVAAGSGSLRIVQASSSVVLSSAGTSYAGLPLTVGLSVAPAISGSPTGAVTLLDNGAPVASGMVANGQATMAFVPAGSGAHLLTASYAGDANFLPSTSAVVTTTVAAMPDFSVAAAGASAQTVQVGTMAVFNLSVAANPGPFSGAVVLSASGLPSGVHATFAPTSLVPGSGSVMTTMSIPTGTLLGDARRSGTVLVWFAGGVPLLLLAGRRRRGYGVAVVGACVFLPLLGGCGTRTVPEVASGGRSYTITVTATGTNLAGSVVSHGTQVTLSVQ